MPATYDGRKPEPPYEIDAGVYALGVQDGRNEAARLADAVYIRLIGGEPKACPCGNGRIPTGAYRAAVDAFAAAIRDLS